MSARKFEPMCIETHALLVQQEFLFILQEHPYHKTGFWLHKTVVPEVDRNTLLKSIASQKKTQKPAACQRTRNVETGWVFFRYFLSWKAMNFLLETVSERCRMFQTIPISMSMGLASTLLKSTNYRRTDPKLTVQIFFSFIVKTATVKPSQWVSVLPWKLKAAWKSVGTFVLFLYESSGQELLFGSREVLFLCFTVLKQVQRQDFKKKPFELKNTMFVQFLCLF